MPPPARPPPPGAAAATSSSAPSLSTAPPARPPLPSLSSATADGHKPSHAPSRPPPPTTSSSGHLSQSQSGSLARPAEAPARPPPPAAAMGGHTSRPKSVVDAGDHKVPSRPPPPSVVGKDARHGESEPRAAGGTSPPDKRLKRSSVVDDVAGKHDGPKKVKKERKPRKRPSLANVAPPTPLPEPVLLAETLTAEELKDVYASCALSVCNQMAELEDEHAIRTGNDELSLLAKELVGYDAARHDEEQQRLRTAVNCVRRLRVRVDSAKDITAKHGDTSHPYVSVDFQDVQHVTPVVPKSLSPTFEEQFEFVVERAFGTVTFNVWSAHDPSGGKRESPTAPYNKKDKFLGTVSVSLADVMAAGGLLRKTAALDKRSDRSHVSGSLTFSISYTSSLAGKGVSPTSLRTYRRLVDLLLSRDFFLATDGSLRDKRNERLARNVARLHGLSPTEDATIRLERAVNRSLPPMDSDCAEPLAALLLGVLDGSHVLSTKSPTSSPNGAARALPSDLVAILTPALDGVMAYAESWLKQYRDKFPADSFSAADRLGATLRMVESALSLRARAGSVAGREGDAARALIGWITDVKRLGYVTIWQQVEEADSKRPTAAVVEGSGEGASAVEGARLGEVSDEDADEEEGALWRECLRLARLSSRLIDDIKDDSECYAPVFAKAHVDVVAISLEVVCPMHAADLRDCLENVEPENVSGHVFELYTRVRKLYGLCDNLIGRNKTRGSSQFLANPYAAMCEWFSPFVYVWLRTAARKTDEWARNAMAQDNLDFVADGILHSSSAVDIFSSLTSGLDFIRDLEWPDKQEASVFLAKYFDIVNVQVKKYALWLRDAVARASSEFDAERNEPQASGDDSEASETAKSSDGPKGASISSAMCAALNNVAQCYEQTCTLRDTVLNEISALAADDSRRVLISDVVMEAFKLLSGTMDTLVDAFASKLFPAIRDGLLYVGGQGEKKNMRVISVLRRKAKAAVKSDKQWDSRRKESLLKRLRWKRSSDSKTHSDIDDLLEPLTTYLDANLEVLAQYLYEDVFRHVLLAVWEQCVLKSIADVVMHPDDADGHDAKRSMSQRQFGLLKEGLERLRLFLHADGDGLPLADLDSKQFKKVLLMLRIGAMDLANATAEYYRTQADKFAGDWTGPKGVQSGLLQSEVSLFNGSHGRLHVKVRVDAAMELPPMDSSGTCSAFVTVKLAPGDGKECKTAVKARTNNPVFDETFELPVTLSASEVVLVMTVWHSAKEKDEAASAVFLGEAVVSLKSHTTKSVTVHTTPIVPSDSNESHLILALLGMRKDDKAAQEFVRQHKGAVLGRKEAGGKMLDLSFSGDSKVHTVNGHLFRATHFNHPVFCRVCDKMLVGLGKQGYRCDKCQVVCHKKCHTASDVCTSK